MLKDLKDNNEKLEGINHSLQVLLEKNRNTFPRFYFLSDDEVIDIIATDKLDKLQGMLNKIFDGITLLKMDDSGINATHMVSKEKESVKFLKA